MTRVPARRPHAVAEVPPEPILPEESRVPRSVRHVVTAETQTRPVGPDDLAELATLFKGSRNTRHCKCTAFCTSRVQFAAGWLTGGNRTRFESMTADAVQPMGILAFVSGEPPDGARVVRDLATAPRSRAGAGCGVTGTSTRTNWSGFFHACSFGMTIEARESPTRSCAPQLSWPALRMPRAIEGWPVSGPDTLAAERFVGREKVFEAVGFRRVALPAPKRALVRLQLDGTPSAPATVRASRREPLAYLDLYRRMTLLGTGTDVMGPPCGL